MTPYYKLEDLIEKYNLISLNSFYYQMPLYTNKEATHIYALEKHKDEYRIFLTWKKPIPQHVLECIFINKIKNDYDEQTRQNS